MTTHASERSAGRGRRSRLAASAGVAASTLALTLPLGIPTIGRAHAPGRRGAVPKRLMVHAHTFREHGHVAQALLADLTVFLTGIRLAVRPLSLVSAVRPHERLAPTASARGPPGATDARSRGRGYGSIVAISAPHSGLRRKEPTVW
jgi:hypothetical protein